MALAEQGRLSTGPPGPTGRTPRGPPTEAGRPCSPAASGGPRVLSTQCSRLRTAGPVPGDGDWAGRPLQSPHYLPGEVGGLPLGAPSPCPSDCAEPRPLCLPGPGTPSPARPCTWLFKLLPTRHHWDQPLPGAQALLGNRTPYWATRPMRFLSGSILGAPSVKVDSVQPRAPGAAVASRLLLCPQPRCSEASLPRKHCSHPGRGG